MNDRLPPRRQEFDGLVAGWGGDSLEDLLARCQLLAEWWAGHLPLSGPELKVARAMDARLRALGGIPPAMLPS